MPIDTLTIENFKGISKKREFTIKPLTIICGPNSSGKSSFIHALAAFAQTTKLTASQVPIVLDDEYAQIHLGRFLDVIHSKSIKDSFSMSLSKRLFWLSGLQSLKRVLKTQKWCRTSILLKLFLKQQV